MKKLLALSFICILFSAPLSAKALVSMPFGGLVKFSTFCTCTFMWHVTYYPLHPVTYPYVYHSLNYVPETTVPYPLQSSLVPMPLVTSWELGKFLPNTPGNCYMGVEPDCTILPADGTITYTGASSPGFTI